MDTMYRKRGGEAEEALPAKKRQEERQHASDSYSPKIRPRETHPDAIDPDQRISKNLNQMNRRLVDTPADVAVKGKEAVEEATAAGEDRGAKVVTHAAGIKAPVPLAIIFSCVLIAAVFMYMLPFTCRSRSTPIPST